MPGVEKTQSWLELWALSFELLTPSQNAKNRTIMSILPHPNGRINVNFKPCFLLLPALLGLLVSCNKSARPEGILSQADMVKTLTEVYVAEEKVNRLGLVRDSGEKVFDSLRVRIFRNMPYPDSVFKRSLNYYTDRPKEMQDIYTALVDSLQLREQRALNQAPTAATDTTKAK
jgi:hypothetical protein